MKKHVHVCRTPDGRLFATIELTEGKLSITGVSGPYENGNSCGPFGFDFYDWYTVDRLKFTALPEKDVLRLFEVAKRWHLNYMRAGSAAQEEWIRLHEAERGGKDHYQWAIDGLKKAGLHPDPDTGYRYGSAWLKEEVPQDVIDFLNSLPETDLLPRIWQ